MYVVHGIDAWLGDGDANVLTAGLGGQGSPSSLG